MRRPLSWITKRWLIAMAIVLVFPLLVVRAYRQAIPAGAEFYPFWYASFEGPRLYSPDGRRVVQVVFNDAGAMHSGNFGTWLIVDDWLTGKRVVAEGYSDSNVRYRKIPFPLRWIDDRTISVVFKTKRRESTERNSVVSLP
jgi:hypothetical protein